MVASLKIQVLKFCKLIYKSQTSRMKNLSLSESQPLQMSKPWNYEQVKTDWAKCSRERDLFLPWEVWPYFQSDYSKSEFLYGK